MEHQPYSWNGLSAGDMQKEGTWPQGGRCQLEVFSRRMKREHLFLLSLSCLEHDPPVPCFSLDGTICYKEPTCVLLVGS